MNSKYVDQYAPSCNGVACGPCPFTPANPNDPRLYYLATCGTVLTVGDQVLRECRAVDVRNSAFTS